MANLRTDLGRHRCVWPGCKRLAVLLAFVGAVGLSAAAGQIQSGPSLTPPSVAPADPPKTAADTAPTEPVVDVLIRGNKSLPLEKILPNIRTRKGRPFDLELIEEDVRRLDRTRMFVTVRTFYQQVAGGRIVIFDVLERPLLQEIKFVGCKEIGKKTLTKELEKECKLKVGDALDPIVIEEGRRRLEEFYRTKGFSGARVTLLEGNKPEDRKAVFYINEGKKQRVLWVGFVGNTIADDGRLRTQIKTAHPFLWLFNGELDRKQLEEDVERLTAYYRGLGYFRARVGTPLLEFNENENWVKVTFVIDEGVRYKIRNVSVLGNNKYASEELLAELKLKDDAYFNQAMLLGDVRTLQDKYGGVGYVFADVKAEPRFLEEAGQLDLVYNIKEGERYRVGKINVKIKGEYPHTQIATVLNRLSFKPGDVADIREFRASERRLRYSQLFESNPATGSAPKIAYSLPDQNDQDDEDDARPRGEKNTPRPRRGGPAGGMGSGRTAGGSGATFRGQSPDSPAGEREIDVTLGDGSYVVTWDRNGYSGNGPRGEGKNALSVPPALTLALSQRERELNDDLLLAASELTEALSQNRKQQQQMPPRLVLTQQYTPDSLEAGQAGSGDATSTLRWTSGAPAAAETTTPPPSANHTPTTNPSATAASVPPGSPSPSQPDPVRVAQQMWPRPGGPERPPAPSQGEYTPGPIFGESSPFRGGPPYGGDSAPPLDLSVTAEEAMTGRLMFGMGINSDAGVVGTITLDEQNFDWTRFPTSWEDVRNATAFRGAGQQFQLRAMPGTQVQQYMVNFRDPYVFGSKLSLGLSGYYFTRIYPEYRDHRLGGRVATGYQFTPDLSGSLAYRGEKINITDPIDPLLPDLAAVADRNLAMHQFQAILTHDKRDNAFMATEGHLIEMSISETLGSFQYPRAEIDLRKYFTLFQRPDGSGRQVFSLAARACYTGDNTPIYDRFYFGGFSSIRGFSFRGISPQEIGPSFGLPINVGGNFGLLASAEYLFPITADDMLRGVVFCDTGTVEPSINQWHNKYRVAPGFGLRILVPAMGPAPIALDFAFPVAWQPGDTHEMFSFFIGFNR